MATPARKPGFFLHAWRPRLFFFLCRGPGPAPRPQTPWNKCMQNQLGFFFNAWRSRLAFLYAGVQGPLPVLRLLVTRCIFQCSERQSGTGTSARLHTYVYTCLPTSGRSAEPRLFFGPQHPTILLRLLPSATFFLRWHSSMMPAVRTEKTCLRNVLHPF